MLKIDFRFDRFLVQYLLLFLTYLDHILNLILLINSPIMCLIHLPNLLLPPFLSILDHLGSLLNINLLPNILFTLLFNLRRNKLFIMLHKLIFLDLVGPRNLFYMPFLFQLEWVQFYQLPLFFLEFLLVGWRTVVNNIIVDWGNLGVIEGVVRGRGRGMGLRDWLRGILGVES